MPNENRADLSRYRLELAKEFLEDAAENLERDSYRTANNRAYYSIFHAMRAVLALEGVDFKKHSGVISYFREHFIKTGIFDRDCSDIISSASLIRSRSDYDEFYIATKQEVTEQVENAKKICMLIENYLRKREN